MVASWYSIGAQLYRWTMTRPAESQRGPRGRPLSGPLYIPSPFPFPPLPLLSNPLCHCEAAPQKRGSGGSPPRKFFETQITVGEIWWILGELMMTYNRAILGTKSLKNGVMVTVILYKAL